MTRVPHHRRRLSSIAAVMLLGFATAACREETTTGSPSLQSEASTVTLVNDGGVALASVRVRTSARDSILVALLAPGQSVGPFPVSALHESPSAEARVGTRALGTFPVEGFDAFNPARPAGAFVIRLRPTTTADGVDIRVTRAAP